MDAYALVKTIHILSSTLLFGTGLGSAFYMWNAHSGGEVAVIAHVSRKVVLADWLFTTPAVILQPLSGFYLLHLLGLPLTQTWVMWSLALFVLAGLCWLPVVWIQLRVARLADSARVNRTPLPDAYYRYMRLWFILGWPAFISVVAVFFLMVLKPV